MRERLRLLLVMAFALAVLGSSIWNNFHKPRVLILQSYNAEYPWSRDINVGLRRILDGKKGWSVRWFYMDTKRQPWPDYKNNIGVVARRLIDEWKPDVLIAIDDDAQQYVAKHYCNSPTMAVVFCGVNLEAKTYGYDRATNVTGLLERQPLSDVREALLAHARSQGASEKLRVVFIDDTSETVRGDAQNIRNFKWDPLLLLRTELVPHFEAYQQAVLQAQADADILLTSVYRGLKRSPTDPTLVPPGEVIAWVLAHSKVPLVGTNSFHAEDGGMLAIGTSPFEQGEFSARMASAILDQAQPVSQFPIQESRHFVVAFRQSQIDKFKFELPKVYEAAARAANKYYP